MQSYTLSENLTPNCFRENFINSLITTFVSPGAIMQYPFLCRRKKVEKMYLRVRDKCLHLLSREISTPDQYKLSSI